MKAKKTKNKSKLKERETKLSLEKEKAKLLKMIEKYEKPTDFGSDIDHFDEEADEAEELVNQVGISEALRERINEIDSTLLKLKNKSKKNQNQRQKTKRKQK